MAQKVDGIEVEILLDSDKYIKELNKAENKTEQTADKMSKELKEANEEIIDSFGEMGESIDDALVKALGGVTALASAIGGFAFASLVDMDGAMSQFQASTGATNEEMKDFEEVAKNIYGNNWGDNWEDVANSMATVNKSLGLQGEELQYVTEKALTVRDVFGADISESVRATDTLVKNFGLTGDDALNLIVQGYQKNLDYSGEFLDSINEYSVHFEQVGLGAEDMFNIMLTGAESGAFNLDKVG